MSLAPVPLWLSRQEVSWFAVPRSWRLERGEGRGWDILREDGTSWKGCTHSCTVSQIRCFSDSSSLLPHLTSCALLITSHLVVPCVSFPYPPFALCLLLYLGTHISSQVPERWWYQPHSPSQRRQCFKRSLPTLHLFSLLLCLHSYYFWPFGSYNPLVDHVVLYYWNHNCYLC